MKCKDDEIIGFIEFKIDDCIDLFLKKKESIMGMNSYKKKIKVTLKNFVEAYLNGDELYLRLVLASKRFSENEKKELLRW